MDRINDHKNIYLRLQALVSKIFKEINDQKLKKQEKTSSEDANNPL
jgi:hypothetical protein